MLQLLRSLFFRYISSRVIAENGPQDLFDTLKRRIGRVERQALIGHRIHVSGWLQAEKVAMSSGTARVERALGKGSDLTPDARPFEFDLPYDGSVTTLMVQLEGENETEVELRSFSRKRRQLGLARNAAMLSWRILRALPLLIAWRRNPKSVSSMKLKKALGVVDTRKVPIFDSGQLAGGGTTSQELDTQASFNIVLPVFNALDLLDRCLERIENNTDLPWHLIVVEDCSSDPDVRPFLKNWADARPDKVTLIVNEKNLGFIGSVNRAFETVLGRPGHVVLLNSDALVPSNWASRLLAPIDASNTIASVTPISNDAEIFSAPIICGRTILENDRQIDTIDRAAQIGISRELSIAAPTGVGFCMALNRDFVEKVPQLDMAFYPAYGEEVDWCQRTRALGGTHVVVPSLFVGHCGGASFGSTAKLRLIREHGALISQRYPGYDLEVQEFIQTDPVATARMYIAMAWANEMGSGRLPIYLAHSLGGGAETYLRTRIADDIKLRGAAVVLRVGDLARWIVELHTSVGVNALQCEEVQDLKRLLEPVTERQIIYSNGVGDLFPADLPSELLSLLCSEDDKLEVLVHDFFMVSPSYTLLDSEDRYFRIPDGNSRNVDPVHETGCTRCSEKGIAVPVTLSEWQHRWGRLLDAAERITTFSRSSKDIVASVFPECVSKIEVVPHQLPEAVPRISMVENGRGAVVGVLGNIGPHKGAAILSSISRDLRPGEGLVILGQIAPGHRIAAPGTIHGGYKIEDLPGLVAKYGINCWLIPSIWPETFSFATHEALATGLPTFAFDLGAQGAAVRRAPNGHAIALEEGCDPSRSLLKAVREICGSP